MSTSKRRIAAPLGLVFTLGLGLLTGCPKQPPPLPPTEATSLQAPFVLRLFGPDVPPASAGPLTLRAVLQVPPGIAEPMPILVEVTAPDGAVLQNGAARQVISVGGATPEVSLSLAFALSGPLAQPIHVRASLERGEAIRAFAERLYPEPAAPAAARPTTSQPAQLPGIPVATPIETVR